MCSFSELLFCGKKNLWWASWFTKNPWVQFFHTHKKKKCKKEVNIFFMLKNLKIWIGKRINPPTKKNKTKQNKNKNNNNISKYPPTLGVIKIIITNYLDTFSPSTMPTGDVTKQSQIPRSHIIARMYYTFRDFIWIRQENPTGFSNFSSLTEFTHFTWVFKPFTKLVWLWLEQWG